MFSEADSRGVNPGLRILTIDNGGLQAISILRVLQEVCERLSQAEGHSSKTPLRPCELFDVIGGIGTGGWLAILLGRYRLRIDQCLNIYINIANAIDPTRDRLDGTSVPDGAVAIDQATLIGKIDSIIADHGIGQYLVDEEANKSAKPSPRQCHAFAVGVVKRTDDTASKDYRLFRTYRASPSTKHQGPDPAKCKISTACAATAAAKDFLHECSMDGDDTKYWDDSFPRTHNVSGLALDEADSLFGEGLKLDFVINISPGIVTAQDVRQLQRTASKNGLESSSKRRSKIRRIFSAGRIPEFAKYPPCGKPRAATDPGRYAEHKNISRSDTSSSTSSEASQKEREHQKAIRRRLETYAEQSSRDQLYFRLELTPHGDKPYLDDIAKPDRAMNLAENFLQLQQTKDVIAYISTKPDTGSRREQRPPIIEGFITASPRSSAANLGVPTPMKTTECH